MIPDVALWTCRQELVGMKDLKWRQTKHVSQNSFPTTPTKTLPQPQEAVMRKNRVKAQNGRKWRENTEKEKAVNKKKESEGLFSAGDNKELNPHHKKTSYTGIQ